MKPIPLEGRSAELMVVFHSQGQHHSSQELKTMPIAVVRNANSTRIESGSFLTTLGNNNSIKAS
jgi:hypothetical protein